MKNQTPNLKPIDKKLLAYLYHDSRESSAKIAKKLKISREQVSYRIKKFESEGIIKGQVFSSENTDWTVIYSEEIGLAQPCFSRVAFVKPLKDLNLKGLNTRHQQTVGLAMKNNSREDFVDNLTMFGADRCPKVGEMTLFGSPWDGMFAIDRMVRWIVTWK